ncbi:hypothetical protein HDU83_002694 [Entophlyctis luteolus]|nr:hypothetical protein HDU83_002694 [Entophlyctis luteolus]
MTIQRNSRVFRDTGQVHTDHQFHTRQIHSAKCNIFMWARLRTEIASLRGAIVRRQTQHNPRVIASFAYGVLLVLDGTVRAIKSGTVRRTLFRVAITLCVILAVAHILATGAMFPLRVLSRILRAVTARDSWSRAAADAVLEYTGGMFWVLISAVPEAWLYCARYIYPAPMDRMFVEALRSYLGQIENPNFRLRASKEVRKIEAMFDSDSQNRQSNGQNTNKWKWLQDLSAFALRSWNRFKIFVLIWILSRLPLVGILAWPVATIIYVGEKVNKLFAISLAVVYFASPRMAKFLRGPVFRLLMELRALGRELVEPYLSRSKMTKAQKIEWLEKHDATISGFTVPLFVLLWIPFIGPALYFSLANACVARLCLEIFDPVDLERAAGDERDGARSNWISFAPKLSFVDPEVANALLKFAEQGDGLLESLRNRVLKAVDTVLERALLFLREDTHSD